MTRSYSPFLRQRTFIVRCSMLIVQWWLLTAAAPAAIIYSGLQNVAIPYSMDGLYVNVDTNATVTSQPSDFASGPWINPFWGGTKIASNDILRTSVITGTPFAEQVLNHGLGDLLEPMDYYAADYNGSEMHIGSDLNQFQLNAPGYIGFKFDLAGAPRYGWMQIIPNNASADALVVDWAYNTVPNEGIVIGKLEAVPEPGRPMLLLGGLLALLFRRRR